MRVSLGSKVMSIVSFVAITLLALCFVVPYCNIGETLFVSGVLILIYSFQESMINHISLHQRQFLIENIFRPIVRKDASLFDEVVELIPFTHLMRMKFKDGNSYLFWGKSDDELNRSIRILLGDQ